MGATSTQWHALETLVGNMTVWTFVRKRRNLSILALLYSGALVAFVWIFLLGKGCGRL
jgi:hypothetical protein